MRKVKGERRRKQDCSKKKNYKSEKAAQARVGYLNARNIYVKWYKCKLCGGYHISGRSRQTVLDDLFEQIASGKNPKLHRDWMK